MVVRDRSYAAFVRAEQDYEKMKLRDAIKAGHFKSAWGDEDTPDSVGLSQRSGTVTTEETKRADEIKMLREQAIKLREIERLKAALAADLKLKHDREIAERIEAAARAERDRQAHAEMEDLEGFGSF